LQKITDDGVLAYYKFGGLKNVQTMITLFDCKIYIKIFARIRETNVVVSAVSWVRIG